ncbi:MAG: hypothetical protein JSR80_03760 [Verrucomicrobia bacterium]|nr:hypothetical protein [Verrucomicrobiota bacterium]
MRCYLLLFFSLFSLLSAQEDLVKLPISQPLHTVGRLGLGIDVVGWQPLQCPYIYAQVDKTSVNTVSNQMFSIQGGYEAGFRLHADFYCACGYFKLSYLWYQENRSAKTVNPNIIVPALSGVPGDYEFAEGKLHYNYQNVELRWGNFLQKTERCTFDLFATARYARIGHRRESAGLIIGPTETPRPVQSFGPAASTELAPKGYKHPVTVRGEDGKETVYKQAQRPKLDKDKNEIRNAAGEVEQELLYQEYTQLQATRGPVPVGSYRQKVKFEGGGVGIGFENQWNLWCWFGMRAELAALALIGQQKTFFNVTTQASGNAYVNFDSHTAVIPEIDAKIGINYTWYANKLAVIIEVGYEIDYFWKALLLSDNTNKAVHSCENIGFAGPYGRAIIRF